MGSGGVPGGVPGGQDGGSWGMVGVTWGRVELDPRIGQSWGGDRGSGGVK